MDYTRVLLHTVPTAKKEIVDGFATSMEKCIAYAELNTAKRLAAFIGQCAEESASFRTTTEYASGRAYNGRRDLGNVHPGDGIRYKGRGLIQLTGRSNYERAGKALGEDLVLYPLKVAEFPLAADVSAWYWKMRNINRFADKWNLTAVTRAVNGGTLGLHERMMYSNRALEELHRQGMK